MKKIKQHNPRARALQRKVLAEIHRKEASIPERLIVAAELLQEALDEAEMRLNNSREEVGRCD